jgi:glycosyltransferase involved in cell wall biosynthesis
MLELHVHGPAAGTLAGVSSVHRHADAAAALAAAVASSAEMVLVADSALLGALRLPDLEASDVSHAGLCLGGDALLPEVRAAWNGWFFLDPVATRRCTSWKATLHLCAFRPAQARAVGGLDPAYPGAAARLLDLVYRLLLAGARVEHEPSWLPAGTAPAAPAAPVEIDDVSRWLFLLRHVGAIRASLTASIQAVRDRGPAAVAALQRAFELARGSGPTPDATPPAFRLMSGKRTRTVTTVTAIIPTLDRQSYVPGAIRSLLDDTMPPDEIIVVDQTPVARRDPATYAPFASDPRIKVVFLDTAGQAIARNTAIQMARGEWCLLFEDDAVARPRLLENHIACIRASGADVSTAFFLAPHKTDDDLPAQERRYKLASVFGTGNALVHKQALLDVGGLDRAFDRGPGADHDLGVRLYLTGHEIVSNHEASATHFKASSGGMRAHGVWWRTKTRLSDPFPPLTQVYTIQRYYPRDQWLSQLLGYYISAGRRQARSELAWTVGAGAIRTLRALRDVRRLKTTMGWPPGPDMLPGHVIE